MMKHILHALAFLIVCGAAPAPALAEAEQDWMQLVDPDRLKSFDKNNDSIVNGHDWVLMGADERKRTAQFLCGNYAMVTYKSAGEKWDLQNDTDLAALLYTLSSRVEVCLNVYYQKPSNKKDLLSNSAIFFYHEELNFLEKVAQ